MTELTLESKEILPSVHSKCPILFDCAAMTGEADKCENFAVCSLVPRSICWRSRDQQRNID